MRKGAIKNIDVLKGVGIILMILGHMHYSVSYEKFVFGFHMPLSFCVSGYLYKYNALVKEVYCNKSSEPSGSLFTLLLVILYCYGCLLWKRCYDHRDGVYL